MHHYKLILFYIATGFLTLGWGLTKPDVKLGSNYNYITLGKLDKDEEPYSLDCDFDLDESEALTSVTWHYNKMDRIIFDWKPNEEPLVYEFLVGRVNLTQDDGTIKFLERHREYEGSYYCQVTTTEATAVSDPFQLVTADFGSRTYSSKSSAPDKDCVQLVSHDTPALYPPPQIDYGLWDGENWIEKVPLITINYSNGSRQYSLQDHKFQVDTIPKGTTYRLAIGFIIEKEYIPVWTETASIPQCTKRPTNSGNDGSDGGDNGGDDGGDNGGNPVNKEEGSGGDRIVATAHLVSLAASAAIVLRHLSVYY